MASIIFLKDRKKCYAIQEYYKDRETNKTKKKVIASFYSREEAEEFLFKYKEANGQLSLSNVTFKDMFDAYKRSKAYNRIETDNTKKAYNNLIKKHFSVFFDRLMISIKVYELQEVLDKMYKNPSKNAINILRQIYREALKNDYVAKDITQYLEASTLEKREVKRYFIESEFIDFLWKYYEENNDDTCAALLVLFYTGMRSNELMRLTNNNIFLYEDYCLTGSKTRAGRNRIIPIHKQIKPIIEKYYINNKEKLFTFLKSEDTLRKRFERFLEHHHIKYRYNLHSIRHTFISVANKYISKEQSIRDMFILQKIVGHAIKDNITLRTYTHFEITDLVGFINRIKM